MTPPTADQWADPKYKIPHWRVLGKEEKPKAGDVVAQQISYRDASGHVMIVGPNNTVIGTGGRGPGGPNRSFGPNGDTYGPHGTIERIPMPATLGPPGLPAGPLVFRRYEE